MTVGAKWSLGLVVLTGSLVSACSGGPTSPTAAQSSASGLSAPVSPLATAATVSNSGADLQVSGSASTGSPNPGATFTYTFQVKNSGPNPATAPTLTDALPVGTGFVSAAVNGVPGACSLVDTMVSCNLGDLASGAQATVAIAVTAPLAAGTFTNTGSVASSVLDPNGSNNSVTVNAQVKAPATDTIKVTKCYTNATVTGGGEMLIKASSSDVAARLFAYRPDGTLIGELQNGGGSRYGGTVMPYQPYDPLNVTIRSSSGGTITVPTTPFQI